MKNPGSGDGQIERLFEAAMEEVAQKGLGASDRNITLAAMNYVGSRNLKAYVEGIDRIVDKVVVGLNQRQELKPKEVVIRWGIPAGLGGSFLGLITVLLNKLLS